jgi:hypothetical protein
MHIDPRRVFHNDTATSRPAADERQDVRSANRRGRPSPVRRFASKRKISRASGPRSDAHRSSSARLSYSIKAHQCIRLKTLARQIARANNMSWRSNP